MSVLHRMDDFLLDRVAQPAADWIEQRTGVSPYRLAANLFLADSAMTIPRAVSWVQDGAAWMAAITSFAMAYSIALAFQAQRLDSRRSLGGMSPARAIHRFTRLFSALLTGAVALPGGLMQALFGVYTWRAGLLDLSFVAFTSATYFLACNRPPPRLQEALDPRMAATAAS